MKQITETNNYEIMVIISSQYAEHEINEFNEE
jgi:hypothetical protein